MIEGRKPRVLCVCNGGVCRSNVLAEAFKGTFGCDAIAIGTFWTTPETMRMLCEWADIIAPAERRDAKLPPSDLKVWGDSPIWEEQYKRKLRFPDIGPDIWGYGKYEELKLICLQKAAEIMQRTFCG